MTSRAETWGVPLLLALLVFLFFLGILVTNRYVVPWDATSYYYPMTFFLVENLKQFSVPLWNPHIFAGLPSAADPQVSTFYPSKWLLAMLSAGSPLSYKLYETELVFHYFLAGLFMFRFLCSVGLLRFSALTGAFTFMFSGALVGRAQHHTIILAMAWVPLLFMYVRRAIVDVEARVSNAVKAGLVLGLQLLAGHPQTSVYTAVAIGFYCVWEGVVCSAESGRFRNLWRNVGCLVLIGVIGAGVAAVQLLPTAEVIRSSIRGPRPEIEADFIGPLNPIVLIKLVLPNLWGGLQRSAVWHDHDPTETTVYVGIVALMLIAIALRFLDRRTLVWVVGAVFFLLLAMADFLYWPRLFYYLAPKLNLFARHGNYFLFTTFCLSVLAGFGMDHLWHKQPETLAFVQKMGRWGLLVVFLGLMLSSAMVLVPAAEAQARVFGVVNNQIIAAVFFFLALGLFLLTLTQKLADPILKTLIVTLMVIDVFTFNSHQTFTQDRVHPETFLSPREVDGSSMWPDLLRADAGGDFRKDYRIATFRLGEIWSNAGNVVGFLNLFGYDPIALQSYTSLLSEVVGKFERTPEFNVVPDVHASILDVASMKYLLIYGELREKLAFRADKYTLVRQTQWISAYLNKTFCPRAHLLPRVQVLPGGIPAAGFMTSPAFAPAEMALVGSSASGDVPAELTSPPPVIFLQAEDFASKSPQGRIVSFAHAWNQKVLAGWGNSAGDVVTYRFDAPAPLPSTVLFLRYAMETDHSAFLDLYVDGATTKLASLECPPTPGWGGVTSDWRYVSAKLSPLAQGSHELKLVSSIGGPIHPDALMIRGENRNQSAGTATITDSKPNYVRIEAQAPGETFLVLSDVIYAGWRATVDGLPVNILQTNAVFRGLPLAPGNHTIEFRFRPRSVYLGAVLSLITLAVSSYGLFGSARLRRSGSTP